jgi:thiol-disulfide isomerase/thioredoxin
MVAIFGVSRGPCVGILALVGLCLFSGLVIAQEGPPTDLSPEEMAAMEEAMLEAFDQPSPLGKALLWTGWIAFTLSGFWFLVVAFREGVGWGIACFFLYPIAHFIFLIKHWSQGWKPFVVGTLGIVLCVIGVGLMGASVFGEIFDMAQARTPENFTSMLDEMVDETESAADSADAADTEDDSGVRPDRSAFPVKVGDPIIEAMKKFDPPRGRLEQGRKKMYSYDDFRLISDDGQTVTQIEFSEDYMTIQNGYEDDYGSSSSGADDSASATPVARGDPIATVKNGGKNVKMKSLLVPGKVTVVDFYADWCMPCKNMAPKLEKIAKGDADVFLRKVDIVNWGTPVANQYDINSIPFVCVYNRKGSRVGTPTSDLEAIQSYIAKAK